MALFEIKNVALRGVSAVVPPGKVSSYDFSFFTHEEVEMFMNTVGVKNRYMADDTICASDMCCIAAERLIKDLGWNKEDIGLLSFESVTGDYRTPPTSCILQDRLSLPTSCMTFDLPMGCCGMLYSVAIVGNMMQAGYIKKALLLIGDTITRMSSPYDQSRVPLFGDCGTALALEYDETADKIIADFNTLGSGFQSLITPHGGFRHPVTLESFKYEDFGHGIVRAPIHSVIQGMDVFAFAISKPPKSIKSLLEIYNINKDNDVDYFLFHQANKKIVDTIVKKVKIDPDKVPSNIEEFANTGGASIAMLMVTNIKNEIKNKPLTLLLSAFGLGLTWGTMVLKTSKIVVSDLIIMNNTNNKGTE